MSIFSSRYFTVNDPIIRDFQWEDILFEFYNRGWWSRVYEYNWLLSACSSFFPDINKKSAIDIATGNQHPGMFLLKKLGFNNVVGTDIFEKNNHVFNKYINGGIRYLCDDILETKIDNKFDCVVCISALEHFNSQDQIKVLNNLVKMVDDQGCIILTFDMPGFEYKTDISLYENILSSNNFYYINEKVDKSEVLTTENSPISNILNGRGLSCYRIFASRKKI